MFWKRDIKQARKHLKEIVKLIKKKTIKDNELINQINNQKNLIDESKRNVRSLRIKALSICLYDVPIVSFLFLFINIVVISFDYGIGSINLLLLSIVFSVIEILSFFVINYSYLLIKSHFLEKSFRDKQDFLFEKAINSIKSEDSSEQIINYTGLKPLFSNKKIVYGFVSIFVFILISFAVNLFVPFSSGKLTNEFMIFSIENQSYVSVFSNDEMIIVERAEIRDDKLTVYTNDQMIIPIKSDIIAYKTIKVDSVEKIE